MSSVNHQGLHEDVAEEIITNAYDAITKIVYKADTKNGGATITNKVFICTDNSGLLPEINAKLDPWLKDHVFTFYPRFKAAEDRGLNKTIILYCLTTDHKQYLKKKKQEILASQIALGIIIPLGADGQQLNPKDFIELVHSN